MRIIEKTVSLENAEMIFEIIADVLTKNINAQVFIDDKILDELRSSRKHHVSNPNYEKTFYYHHEQDGYGGEEWYDFNQEGKKRAVCSFISNCNGYGRLVEFKQLGYTHFMVGFKYLLLIKKERNK